MTQTKTRVLTAHVPIPLTKKVDKLAHHLERSRGWVMKQALSAWVEQEEERDRLTQEALADVDAGRVVEHRAVLEWTESLNTSSIYCDFGTQWKKDNTSGKVNHIRQ